MSPRTRPVRIHRVLQEKPSHPRWEHIFLLSKLAVPCRSGPFFFHLSSGTAHFDRRAGDERIFERPQKSELSTVRWGPGTHPSIKMLMKIPPWEGILGPCFCFLSHLTVPSIIRVLDRSKNHPAFDKFAQRSNILCSWKFGLRAVPSANRVFD